MRRLQLFYILLLTAPSQILIGQELPGIPSSIRREIIEVIDTSSGYISTVSFQCSPPYKGLHFDIYYNSLETVTDYEVYYYSSKGKWKLFRKGDHRDMPAPTDDFYSCERTQALELPEKLPFKINYKIKSEELLLQSSLMFFSRFPIDTFYYEIIVPKDYRFRFNLLFPEKLKFFKIDSVHDRRDSKYYITGVPKNNKSQDYSNPGIKIRENMSLLFTYFLPIGYKGDETKYFIDWILGKARSKMQLDSHSKKLIDSITNNQRNKDSIVNILFNYVRDHIKYLAITIGHGAIIPHDVNKTLRNRQGDCKDMSSLLCLALRYKGIEAWLALTSTSDRMTEMCYPSLSAGNHMICVAQIENGFRFLDPTYKDGSCRISPFGIQGRKVLILGLGDGTYTTVPPEEPESNQETFDFLLELKNECLSGTLRYTAHGLSMHYFKHFFMETSHREWASVATEILSTMIKGCNFSQATIVEAEDSITVKFNIILSPTLFTRNGDAAYLSLGFLPSPMQIFSTSGIKGDVILDYQVLRNVNVQIEMGQTFHSAVLKPIHFDKDGFNYHISVSGNAPVLKIQSSFRCEKLFISEHELPAFQNFCDFITTSNNNAITIK